MELHVLRRRHKKTIISHALATESTVRSILSTSSTEIDRVEVDFVANVYESLGYCWCIIAYGRGLMIVYALIDDRQNVLSQRSVEIVPGHRSRLNTLHVDCITGNKWLVDLPVCLPLRVLSFSVHFREISALRKESVYRMLAVLVQSRYREY